MPAALGRTIADVRAGGVVVSYNDESWVDLDELRDMCATHGEVAALAFDSKRYVGDQSGIHDPQGHEDVTVGLRRDLVYVLVAGPRDRVRYMTEPFDDALTAARAARQPRKSR